ncbi:hypothetical protein [Peribacillus sp. SCS-155]|uniref:hypothetical protein n=1 Tax=Peribacillus sedimenti TaxID=3115297 RepID=UPI003905C8FC
MTDYINCIVIDGPFIEKTSVENSQLALEAELMGAVDFAELGQNIVVLFNEDAISLHLRPNVLGSYGKLIFCKRIFWEFSSLNESEQDQLLAKLHEAITDTGV